MFCFWLTAGQAPAADPYAGGVTAFKQGDYDRALTLFLQAQRAGRESEALRYNLAATYYRLGRYDEAARLFRSLLPSQPVLAAYNLGLVARARGDREAASRWFEESLRAADPGSRLARLARRALDRVGPGDAERMSRRADGGAQMAVGYDDNVAFEPAGGRDNREDTFVEGYFWGRYGWGLTGRDRLSLSAGLYTLRFADYTRYDLLDLTGRAKWRHEFGSQWRFEAKGKAGRLWQDGTAALDSVGGGVTISRALGGAWLVGAGYSGTQYEAAEDYAYLDGSRHDLSVEGDYVADRWWWRMRYVRRWDNRSDSDYDGGFASYSPRSHRLSLRAGYGIDEDWSVEAEMDWRRLDYPEPDVFSANGETVRRKRADEYRGWSLRLLRDLGDAWQVYAEYRHGDNDSNIDSNMYTRNVAMLGIGWRLP